MRRLSLKDSIISWISYERQSFPKDRQVSTKTAMLYQVLGKCALIDLGVKSYASCGVKAAMSRSIPMTSVWWWNRIVHPVGLEVPIQVKKLCRLIQKSMVKFRSGAWAWEHRYWLGSMGRLTPMEVGHFDYIPVREIATGKSNNEYR